jgi:aspartyl-tRNA synthetase
VAALRLPRWGDLSRKDDRRLHQVRLRYGARGLAYIKVNDINAGREGLQSPIVKFLPDTVVVGILSRTGAEDGDLIFFGADKANIVNESLGALRVKLGHDRGLVERGWKPLWIVDFPMFEFDEKEERWVALHHPFTSRQARPERAAGTQRSGQDRCRVPTTSCSMATELGGGSVRIHTTARCSRRCSKMLGIDEAEAREKFGFLLNALKYGCPPDGGRRLRPGPPRHADDRRPARMRDVIAFPKTQTAHCPLTNAPAEVPDAQLRELGIRVKKQTA